MNMKSLAGAAMVAVAVAGCCDKNRCKPEEAAKPAEAAEAAPAPADTIGAVAATPAKDPNEVIVSVGDEKLTRGEIDALTEKLMATYGGTIPAEQLALRKIQANHQIAQQFLVETALSQKAKELGYAVTVEEVEAKKKEALANASKRPGGPKTFDDILESHPGGKELALKEFNAGILIDKMIKAEVVDKAPAEDHSEEAKDIIARIEEANKSVMSDEEALKKIKELKDQLDKAPEAGKAELFAKLANENSACPSREKGGNLGEFGHGQMVPEFDKAAFALEVGRISEPVKTTYGYHLIMTTAKSTNDTVTASHILIKTGEKQKVPTVEEINEFYRRNSSRGKINEFVIDVVSKAKVTTAPDFASILPNPPPPAAPETAPEAKSGEKPAEAAPAAEPEAKPEEKPAEAAPAAPVEAAPEK